jgi:predicted RNA-binding protein associated with RNAse of E/G family
MATWRVPERALHLSADVCGWVRRERDLVVYEDWELDPFLLRSGVIGVEDLDEFVAEVDSGELSRESAERALRAAAEVEGLFKARSGPFDDRGDRLLAESGELGLPPLRQVPHPLEI